jgi:YVTN family beta-propeller protein
MNLRISGLIAAFALAGILGSAQSFGQNAYIANALSNNVSVINTQTNTVIGSPIPVGNFPWGVAVSPDGGKVYVTVINGTERTSGVSGGVAVIDTRTNTVIATFPAGNDPTGLAVDPNGGRLYVANDNFPVSTVTVIDAATGATVAAIPTAAQNTNSIATGGAEAAEFDAIELRWIEWARWSGRQQSLLRMGGLLGAMSLSLEGLEPFWPFLALAPWVHVGKGATMGLGAMRVVAA